MTAASKSIERSSGKAGGLLDESLRLAIRELQDTPSLANQLLNSAPVQLLVLDRTLIVRWVNSGFAEARKVAATEAVGVQASQYFGELSSHSTHFDRALAGESSHFVMRTTALPDNSVRDLNVYLRPIFDARDVSGICVCVGDLGFSRGDTERFAQNFLNFPQVVAQIDAFIALQDL